MPSSKGNVEPAVNVTTSASKKKKWKTELSGWLFLLPFLLVYFVFLLFPVIRGLYLSFFDWTIGSEMSFVGLNNYLYMFTDRHFWRAIWNTIYFVLLSTPVLVVFGLMFALIVNSKLKGTTFLRSIFFLPYILSVSVISYLWVFILQPYSGLLNSILSNFGIGEIFWLNETGLAWLSIVVATLWWTVGFNMVLYLAGLQEIPDEYYEAAKVDGANAWQRFFFITIPSLKRITLLIIILQTIASFKVFGQVWLMTGGGPGTSTRTLVQYIYETGFRADNMGYASAMSYVLFLVTIIISFVQFKLFSAKD